MGMTAQAHSDEDLDRLALENPEEYRRLVQGFKLLIGDETPPDDTRIGSVPTTVHLDARRFSLGLETLTHGGNPLRPREFAVIGAYPGHGKTSFAEIIAIDNARLEHRTLFATLEMEREDIRDRMLSKILKSGIESIYSARQIGGIEMLADAEKMFRSELSELHLWEPPARERTIQAVTKRAENLGAAILIIDYSAMLTGWEAGNRAKEIVNYLWEWIKKTGISTFLFTQLKPPDGPLRRPTMFTYQDTSALSQRSTRAIILWRPYLGNPQYDYLVEVLLAKNRWGPCFMCHAHWVPEFGAFLPMDDIDEANARCCQRHKK